MAARDVVELRYELGQPDWSDTFHARGRVRGIKGRLQGLLPPVLFAVTVWLLADNALPAGIAFLGGLFGLVVRTGVLAARHAKMGAPLGPWCLRRWGPQRRGGRPRAGRQQDERESANSRNSAALWTLGLSQMSTIGPAELLVCGDQQVPVLAPGEALASVAPAVVLDMCSLVGAHVQTKAASVYAGYRTE